MMKSKIFSSVFLVISFLFASMLFAGEVKTDWDSLSLSLIKAIKSGSPGLQQSAMQHIIQHTDKLDTEECVNTIGRIFCYSTNKAERRLALVTLGKINSLKSMAYIYQGMITENDKSIRKQGCCILGEYCNANADLSANDLRLSLMEKYIKRLF